MKHDMKVMLTKDEASAILADHFSKLYGYGPVKQVKMTPYGEFVAELTVEVDPQRYIVPPTLTQTVAPTEANPTIGGES